MYCFRFLLNGMGTGSKGEAASQKVDKQNRPRDSIHYRPRTPKNENSHSRVVYTIPLHCSVPKGCHEKIQPDPYRTGNFLYIPCDADDCIFSLSTKPRFFVERGGSTQATTATTQQKRKEARWLRIRWWWMCVVGRAKQC